MTRPCLLLAPILALLVLPLSVRAQTEPATDAPAEAEQESRSAEVADPEFEDLARDFRVIWETIRNSRELAEADRPAVAAYRDRVEAYLEEHPDHERALAIALQLALWLEERDRASELYQRLLDLRPDDIDLALSWRDFQVGGEATDAEAGFEAERTLFERFPDDPRVRLNWARALKSRMRYEEAQEVLEGGDFDPAEDPRAWLTLAYVQFAEHKFDEALATYQSIPSAALSDPALRREYEGVKEAFESYPQFWAEEQERRRQEESAGDLPVVEIQTTKGPIVVQLFEDHAPNTVANFIYLAEQRFYDQTKFHEYLEELVIEGGDPNTLPGAEGEAGQGGPGYTIPDESRLEDARLHFRDSIAMARGRLNNSAGSRFYFTHRPIPQRNNYNTVFGRVIEGLDVVRSLREDDSMIMMLVRQKREHEYVPDTIPVAGQPSAAGVSPDGPPTPDVPGPATPEGDGEDEATQGPPPADEPATEEPSTPGEDGVEQIFGKALDLPFMSPSHVLFVN